jgi:uncharacterized protein YndB with AHSA1/START domain
MAPIRQSIEIARSPEDVFAYLDDLARHGEWQDGIISARVDTDGPTRVGTKATEVRHMGGKDQEITYEITEHDPPRGFAFRGVDGPVRVVGRSTVEPVGDGTSTRVTVELDFEGHGLGRALAPLARKQAAKAVPASQQKLKSLLESGAA